MTNLIYLLIALILLVVISILDSLSHQKFSKRVALVYHLIALPILVISGLILIIQEFRFTILIYPGILIGIAGLLIAYKGLIEIKPNLLKAGEVYKKGLYSRVRHPVYSGLIIALIGLSLFVYSLIFLVYSVVAVLMLIWLASYEEKHLIRRFGKKYLKYRTEVPMLIPRL